MGQLLCTGDRICDFPFAFLHTVSLIKGGYFKKKEFDPEGSKFFHFRADTFSREANNPYKTDSLELYSYQAEEDSIN